MTETKAKQNIPKEWTLTKKEKGINPFIKEKTYLVTLDLEELVKKIDFYLIGDQWLVQSGNTDQGKIIQANKGGIIRQILAANRALTIVFTNIPNGIKVEVGIGKWIENLTSTAIEVALLGPIFLVVDIPMMLWNAEIENKVLAKIDQFVEELMK
jgi:hypothetical protein